MFRVPFGHGTEALDAKNKNVEVTVGFYDFWCLLGRGAGAMSAKNGQPPVVRHLLPRHSHIAIGCHGQAPWVLSVMVSQRALNAAWSVV